MSNAVAASFDQQILQGVEGAIPSHVHDIGGDDGFVVLPSSYLTEIQQIPDDCDKESILLVLHHAPTDATNGPAEGVESAPAPFFAIEL